MNSIQLSVFAEFISAQSVRIMSNTIMKLIICESVATVFGLTTFAFCNSLTNSIKKAEKKYFPISGIQRIESHATNFWLTTFDNNLCRTCFGMLGLTRFEFLKALLINKLKVKKNKNLVACLQVIDNQNAFFTPTRFETKSYKPLSISYLIVL